MAIPHILLPVRPQDYVTTPFVLHKRYTISYNDWSGSGYTNHEGLYSNIITPISSSKAANDPKNSDGTYKHIIWRAIDSRFYKYKYDAAYGNENTNRRYTYKNLFLTSSILSVPYLDSGEGLKRGSIEVTSSGIYLSDDKHGNLYDTGFVTCSYADRNKLVGYWGFNDLFRATRYGYGYKNRISIDFLSHQFEPDTKSVGKNIYIQPGVTVHTPYTSSGIAIGLRGNGNVVTHHRPEFNFATNQDFTISYFIKLPSLQINTGSSNTNTILSKRGSVLRMNYGNLPHLNQNGEIITTKFHSQSFHNEQTNVYPYHFEVYNQNTADNGKIVFSRSDGTSTCRLVATSSISSGSWHHVVVTKNNRTLSLYIDNELHTTGSEVIHHPNNDYLLTFGADNIDYKYGLSGSLDEIRMYNYAVTTSSIQSLGERITGSLYQTSVVGNCFYKNSTIVVSSLLPKYEKIFSNNNWGVKFRNTHTIFQNEVFCRIKKGSANLSTNPTVRQSPDSDLFINDFTGSLLKPYITTIGLYNNTGDLVAIAKLGQPVQVRDDVDVTIKVLWDN